MGPDGIECGLIEREKPARGDLVVVADLVEPDGRPMMMLANMNGMTSRYCVHRVARPRLPVSGNAGRDLRMSRSRSACGRKAHTVGAPWFGVVSSGRTWILVVRLCRVEIHSSARRHQIPDEDIRHAYEHAVAWAELGDDPPRYLMAGADRAGNLLELVVMELKQEVLVIHAMKLRRSTEQELLREDS